MTTPESALRAKWQAGEVTVCGWLHLGDPLVTEVMAAADFDFMIVDQQHGLGGKSSIAPMLLACRAAGRAAIVRTATRDPAEIGFALDAGADGVMVPSVSSPAEMEAIVSATRYGGTRGWGPMRRPLFVSRSTTDEDTSVIVVPIIETVAGAQSVEQIAAVEGVDAVFVGPGDLALSNGWTFEQAAQEPAYHDQIEGIAAACRSRGLACGIPFGAYYGFDAEEASRRLKQGFTIFIGGFDNQLLRRGAQVALEELRSVAAAAT